MYTTGSVYRVYSILPLPTPPLIFTGGSQKVWYLASIFDTTFLWAGPHFETKQHSYQSRYHIWCSDDGTLFSSNLVQFGAPPLISRVWKSTPLKKWLNRQYIIRGLIDLDQIWYIVWSHDTRPTTHFQGLGVKGQGHSVTQQGQEFANYWLSIIQPRIVHFRSNSLHTMTWPRDTRPTTKFQGQGGTFFR